MGHTGRRISRGLIGALIVTIVLGLAFYLKNIKRTEAQVAGPPPVKSALAEQIAAASTAAPLKVAPATQPLPETPQVALASEPTTKPAQQPKPDPAPAPALNVIAQAQSKKDANDLLGARSILNDALQAGALSPADADSARKMISDINQAVVFSSRRFADDPFGGTYSVQPGDVLQKIAVKYEVTPEALARLNGITDPKKLRAGQTIKVIHGPFNAVVTKGKFTLDIYLGPPGEKGGLYVTTYPVGLGKDDSTPSGVWLVEAGKKLKDPTYYSPRGEGVIDAGDPKNPLGHRWIGLTGIDGQALGKSSYGIHGTIDENSIGKQESMGCIRMHNADVEWVFDLLVDGKSSVIVKD